MHPNCKVHFSSNVTYILCTQGMISSAKRGWKKILLDDITVLKLTEEWARGSGAIETQVSVQQGATVCMECNWQGTQASQLPISRVPTHNSNNNHLSQFQLWGFHMFPPRHPTVLLKPLFIPFCTQSPISRVLPAATPPRHSSQRCSGDKLQHADQSAGRLSAVVSTVNDGQRGKKYVQQECNVSQSQTDVLIWQLWKLFC